MVPCPGRTRYSFLLPRFDGSTWCGLLNLLENHVSRVHLVNYCEETGNLGLVTRHHLQVVHKIVSLLVVKKGKFVDILTVTHVVHFVRVLVQFEYFEQLVDR